MTSGVKAPRADKVGPSESGGELSGFRVCLDEFEGPFDLLLNLIAKHQLDVTAMALSKVTDDFLAHLRELGSQWEIGRVTEFLVVAATLLDLKAARLLPSAHVEDEEDLALLEARDLLVARLLQYRAVKQVAEQLAERWVEAGKAHPRSVALEPEFAKVPPELVLQLTPSQLADIATRALTPKPQPTVSLAHLHLPAVSVPEQAGLLRERLSTARVLTFRALTEDAGESIVVVARFLALLELYREGAVAFDQVTPLGELHVRWLGDTVDLRDPSPVVPLQAEEVTPR